jgi:general secretion pathway protein K
MKRTKNLPTDSTQEQGTVLLVVLMIISLLVVVAIEGFRSTQVDISSAYLFAHGLEAGNINRSALAYAQALLAYDRKQNNFDHYGDLWAKPQKQNKIQRPESNRGSFALRVIDESGKLPINYLAGADQREGQKTNKDQNQIIYQSILRRILTHKPFSLEKDNADELLNSLVDWISKDEQENDDPEKEPKEYYADFQDSNNTKDSPFTFISELLLVKGISKELYYGNSKEPGLKDLLTVHSDNGKININTASTYLLQAMVPDSVHWDTAVKFAQNMKSYRQDNMHWEFLDNPDWYKNKMPGYNDIQLPTKLITTSSSYFAIHSNATVGGSCENVFAYVHRKPDKFSNDDEKARAGKLDIIYQEYY